LSRVQSRAPRRQPRRREQLRVDIADTEAEQPVPLDEREQLVGLADDRLWQCRQLLQDFAALPGRAQMPHRKLTDHPRMSKDPALMKEPQQRRLAIAEMVDPNRGVDQDHSTGSLLRRGAASASGTVPPRRIKRRAASR
jgi:hypothetical protein